jgi:hypothetical protein
MPGLYAETFAPTSPHLCARHRDPVERPRDKRLFSPRTWAGLDSRDKHGNEGSFGDTRAFKIAGIEMSTLSTVILGRDPRRGIGEFFETPAPTIVSASSSGLTRGSNHANQISDA